MTRAGGTFTNGRFLHKDDQGNDIWEPGPLSVILTGSNLGGPPDIFLDINSAFVESNYWFDPTPENRTDETVPRGKTDFVSIVLHELGHALGIAGPRNLNPGTSYGTLPGYGNSMDELSYFAGDGNPLDSQGRPNPMFFAGVKAAKEFGSDVPLSHVGPNHRLHSQDFYHLGTCGDPAILTGALMNGCTVPVDGTRLQITPLDLAILEDLGYPLKN